MAELDEFDPYQRPTPYELLGIANGVNATSRDIAKAFNQKKNEARLIKDVKERAARLGELEKTKDQLQRPEDRVLFDFFVLGSDLFVDLSTNLSGKLASGPLPCDEFVGQFTKDGEYDDLLPRPLNQFVSEFETCNEPQWYRDEDFAPARIPLTDGEVGSKSSSVAGNDAPASTQRNSR